MRDRELVSVQLVQRRKIHDRERLVIGQRRQGLDTHVFEEGERMLIDSLSLHVSRE